MNIERITKSIYNAARNYVKRYLTGNLGTVVEEDDKLVCYVNKKKFSKTDYRYILNCYGIGEENLNVASSYNLNKPICYVIEDVKLRERLVHINGFDNCEIIIKNCNFGLGLHVNVEGKCTLENNEITFDKFLLVKANDLVVKNMNKCHILDYKPHIIFLSYNQIDVINSNIGEEYANFSIQAKNSLNIANSQIVGKEIDCVSKNITFDEKSSLKASNTLTIAGDRYQLNNISAPVINVNGEEVVNVKQTVIVNSINDSLTLKRLVLLNQLKKIRDKCKTNNLNKEINYKIELNSQPIGKIFTKK